MSSDGQRFLVAGRIREARAQPPRRRIVTVDTWTNEQFGQCGVKLIPSSERDANYILDEILDMVTRSAMTWSKSCGVFGEATLVSAK